MRATCAHWGFDHTNFGSVGPFLNVLDAIGAKHVAEVVIEDNYRKFVWKGPRVCLTTYYNPVTGENPYGEITDEKGFAGYMGLSGQRAAVGEAVRAIRANALEIKDESPNARDFI